MAHSALVAYGSETGNAEELAVQLSQLTRRLRIWTTIKPLNAITPQQLNNASIVLMVISTTGQGDLPRNAQLFFRRLRSKKLAANFLEKCIFTSFGLGDSSYPQYVVREIIMFDPYLRFGSDSTGHIENWETASSN